MSPSSRLELPVCKKAKLAISKLKGSVWFVAVSLFLSQFPFFSVSYPSYSPCNSVLIRFTDKRQLQVIWGARWVWQHQTRMIRGQREQLNQRSSTYYGFQHFKFSTRRGCRSRIAPCHRQLHNQTSQSQALHENRARLEADLASTLSLRQQAQLRIQIMIEHKNWIFFVQ